MKAANIPHQAKKTFQEKITQLREYLKTRDWKEIHITGTAVFVILLFSYTAVSKLSDYKTFVFQMQLAPLPLIKTVAPFIGRILPWVEIVLALMLSVERTRKLAAKIALILMILFEIYISWMQIVSIQTGIKLPCTCGGIISSLGWVQHLFFNALVILLLALSIHWQKKNTS